VQKISNPVAGLPMAPRCAAVIRGTSIPFVVLVTSSMDDDVGVAVPIPTWEKTLVIQMITRIRVNDTVFMGGII
jgi:hypothetical protein